MYICHSKMSLNWGHIHNPPRECCLLKKNSDICRVFGKIRLTIHIVKVFFASPQMKMWKFSC